MIRKQSVHDAFTLIFSPTSILGAWLTKRSSSPQFIVQQLYQQKLNHLELEKLTIFNPTQIGSLITSWYKKSGKSMPLLAALYGPALEEHILLLHNAHPNSNQFPISHAPHWHWEYTYLYSVDHRHCFYLCGIKKSLIFQYQLMAILHQLPLAILTTERMALLHCYRFLFGSAFRAAQLATAMISHNNRIENLFSVDDLPRIVHIPSHVKITNQTALPLLAACGLFQAQG